MNGQDLISQFDYPETLFATNSMIRPGKCYRMLPLWVFDGAARTSSGWTPN